MNFVVYIDVFFCINFGMNLVVLMLLKYLSRLKSSIPRIILAGAAGGIGACVSILFPGMNLIIKFLLLYVIVSGGMIVIAFSYHGFRNFMGNIVKLYAVSFFVGGLFHFLYYNMGLHDFIRDRLSGGMYQNTTIPFLLGAALLLLAAAPVIIKIYHGFRRKHTVLYEVELWNKENSVKGYGLYDTGNSLKDPVTGKPVVIAEYDTVKELLSLELQEYILNFFRVSLPQESIPGVRWIPYHSLGKSHGFLPGITVERMETEAGGRKQAARQVLIGLYQGTLSAGGEYQFILHEEYISSNY